MLPISLHNEYLLNKLASPSYMHEGETIASQATMLGAIKTRLVDMKNKFGIFIDIIKFYTPVGSLIDIIRGPKSLSQWNPFQHISPGFLTGNLRLPDPNDLSHRPINTTRIIKWATQNLLQAGKLAQAENNANLTNLINKLKSSIRNQDNMHILANASALASSLPNIMQDMDSSANKLPMKYMKCLEDIIESVSQISICDRDIQGLTKPPEVKISFSPMTTKELMKIILDQCMPLVYKAACRKMSLEEINDHKTAALEYRSQLECALFEQCYQLDYPTSADTQEQYARISHEIQDIKARLSQPRPFSPIGEDEQLALLLANDIINHRVSIDLDSSFTRFTKLIDPTITNEQGDLTTILMSEEQTVSRIIDMYNRYMEATFDQLEFHLIPCIIAYDGNSKKYSAHMDRFADLALLAQLYQNDVMKLIQDSMPEGGASSSI